MDVVELKTYLLDNDLVESILSSINCHHIMNHGDYISCGNPDGNNTHAITVYLNENITVVNYTRQISRTKRTTDIFDLISYFLNCTFPESLKYVCGECGLSFYEQPKEIPESLLMLKTIKSMQTENEDYNDIPLVPISEHILNYYINLPNEMFKDDGISYEVQQEFGIGYDPSTNRITIPIRSSIGDLVGVKGRYFGDVDENTVKYCYIERCNKGSILYGFYENINYIKNSDYIIVFESEKSVLQCASHGIRNCVATGGKKITKHQVEMLSRICGRVLIAYDKDVGIDELQHIASMFVHGIKVYAIIDSDDKLAEHESPCDNIETFKYLKKHCIRKVEVGNDKEA